MPVRRLHAGTASRAAIPGLIRTTVRIVQARPLRAARWADVPELSARGGRLSTGLAAVPAAVEHLPRRVPGPQSLRARANRCDLGGFGVSWDETGTGSVI